MQAELPVEIQSIQLGGDQVEITYIETAENSNPRFLRARHLVLTDTRIEADLLADLREAAQEYLDALLLAERLAR